jgi:hypothetical protein
MLRAPADTTGLTGNRAHSLAAYMNAVTSTFPPRNDLERELVERAAQAFGEQENIVRLQTQRISANIEDAERRDAVALERLTKQLFDCRNGSIAQYGSVKNRPARPRSSRASVADDPATLIRQIQRSVAGCEWMLKEWAELRAWVERGIAWDPYQQLKSIRLLGCQPHQAARHRDVFNILVACWSHRWHVHAFTEICSELCDADYTLFLRDLRVMATNNTTRLDPDAARSVLLSIIARAVAQVEAMAAAARERAERDAALRADCLSFDGSAEGERLRKSERRAFDTFITALNQLIDLRASDRKRAPDESKVEVPRAATRSEITIRERAHGPAIASTSVNGFDDGHARPAARRLPTLKAPALQAPGSSGSEDSARAGFAAKTGLNMTQMTMGSLPSSFVSPLPVTVVTQ